MLSYCYSSNFRPIICSPDLSHPVPKYSSPGIVETFMLEKTPINPALLSPSLNMSPSATPIHLLNLFRDGDSCTSLGSLFLCLTTLSVKESFPISNLRVFFTHAHVYVFMCTLLYICIFIHVSFRIRRYNDYFNIKMSKVQRKGNIKTFKNVSSIFAARVLCSLSLS